jgi:hypothetical protein
MSDFVQTPPPDPTITAGLRSADDHLSLDIVADVDREVYQVRPNANPFTVLLNAEQANMKRKECTHYQYHWLSKTNYPDSIKLAAAADADDTALTTESGQASWAGTNQTVMNRRTGEIMYVTAGSGTSLTVVRGIGTSGVGLEMEIGDELELLAPAYPDAAEKGEGRNVKETSLSNYAQIVRWPFEFSGRDIQTEFYTGDDVMNETKHAATTFGIMVEKANLFGKPHSRTHSNGKTQTWMGGLDHFIQQNEWDLGNTEPTERAFVEWLSVVMRHGKGGFDYGNSRKYLYCPRTLLTIIEFWAKDRLRLVDGLKGALGLEVRSYQSAHGEIRLVPDSILDRFGVAFLVDMNHVRSRPFRGRTSKLLKGRESNSMDGKSYEYFVDTGLEVHGTGDGEPHAKIFGESLKS